MDQDFAVVGVVTTPQGGIGDIAVDCDSDTFVATHPGVNSVSVAGRDTLTVGEVPVVGEPFGVVIADDRAFVSTATLDVDSISVIDIATRSVVADYPLAFSVTAVAASPDGKRVFAGRCGPDHVDIAVLDVPAQRVGTIDVARGSGITIDALDVDPTGRYLYVATSDAEGGRLVVVSAETARVATVIEIGAPIRDVAHGIDGTAYVLTSDLISRGVVHVVDLATDRVTDRVSVATAPTQLVLSPDGTRAYIVDYDHVAVLSTVTNEIIDRIAFSGQPACVAVSGNGERLYVADYDGKITVLSEVSVAVSEVYTEPLRATA